MSLVSLRDPCRPLAERRQTASLHQQGEQFGKIVLIAGQVHLGQRDSVMLLHVRRGDRPPIERRTGKRNDLGPPDVGETVVGTRHHRPVRVAHGSDPAELTDVAKGKSDPKARFCGSAAPGTATACLLMRSTSAGAQSDSSWSARFLRTCWRSGSRVWPTSITVVCCVGSTASASAAPAPSGPDPMIKDVGIAGRAPLQCSHYITAMLDGTSSRSRVGEESRNVPPPVSASAAAW